MLSFVWRCQFGVDPICLVGLCRYVSGITSGISLRSAGRGFLSVPFARSLQIACTQTLFVLMARQCEIASLLSCSSYNPGLFPTHSIVVLKLFYLTVLVSGAPLRISGLEEALQTFLNELMQVDSYLVANGKFQMLVVSGAY